MYVENVEISIEILENELYVLCTDESVIYAEKNEV